MTIALLTSLALVLADAGPVAQHEAVVRNTAFDLSARAEVVATIDATCSACDWSVAGREAVLLELKVYGEYSQHLALVRGTESAAFRVLLGSLPPGHHELGIEQDEVRSARQAGRAQVQAVRIETFGPDSTAYRWLSLAPVLRA